MNALPHDEGRPGQDGLDVDNNTTTSTVRQATDVASELRALADDLDGGADPICDNRCGSLDWSGREMYARLGTCPCRMSA